MRTIDADALIDNMVDYVVDGYAESPIDFESYTKMVQTAPTIDAVSVEWIPCEERLPKPRESVLLAVNNKYGDWVGEGCYWETTANHVIWKGYRWNATYWNDEIIAWMPLPKPWKGADDETN